MPRPKNPSSRPYGRQAEGKTIKSLSIDSDLLAKAEKEAKKKGMNFSEYISALLKGTLILAVMLHAARSGSDWSADSLLATGKVAWSFLAGIIS